MKLKELPNQDPKSFEFAAFKWLVKRFARPSRRLCVGMTDWNSVAITVNGEMIWNETNLVRLCQEIDARGLK